MKPILVCPTVLAETDSSVHDIALLTQAIQASTNTIDVDLASKLSRLAPSHVHEYLAKFGWDEHRIRWVLNCEPYSNGVDSTDTLGDTVFCVCGRNASRPTLLAIFSRDHSGWQPVWDTLVGMDLGRPRDSHRRCELGTADPTSHHRFRPLGHEIRWLCVHILRRSCRQSDRSSKWLVV